MVFLKLVDIGLCKAAYAYMPERQDSEPGLIAVDLDSGKMTLEKRAPGDDMGYYANHAATRLSEEKLSRDKMPGLLCSVWY